MLLAYKLWPTQRDSERARDKILLLHGMGGTGALWRPIAATLENDFDILAPDQRGHGGSIVPTVPGARSKPGYSPLDYGRDVIETMESLAFHPAWVVGHSMGVRSACGAAFLKPEWVRGLVLIDLGLSGAAGGGLGEGLAEFLRKLPPSFPSRAEGRAFMAAECPDPAIAQYLMAVSVTRPGSAEISFPFDKGALIETIHSAEDSSARTWVHEAASRGMPVLVLRGSNSLVWSHDEFEVERAASAAYPSIRFEEFPGAGHGLPFEKRAEFIERLKAFVLQ